MSLEQKDNNLLTVGLAKMAPVWAHQKRTIEKVESKVCKLQSKDVIYWCLARRWFPAIPFGWSLPTGLDSTPGCRKTIFAEYAAQVVQPGAGHLDGVCEVSAEHRVAVYLGRVEVAVSCRRPPGPPPVLFAHFHRQCRRDPISSSQTDANLIREAGGSVRRWARAGNHPLHAFPVGRLSCWENWMPLGPVDSVCAR